MAIVTQKKTKSLNFMVEAKSNSDKYLLYNLILIIIIC